jgi:hypothetical protein
MRHGGIEERMGFAHCGFMPSNLVRSIVEERSHPALNGLFRTLDTGEVTGDSVARIGVGKKRFKIHGALIYNQWLRMQDQ